MRRIRLLCLTGVMVVMFAALPALAQESFNGRYNIEALMTSAENNFDPSGRDGVFLLDAEKITWGADGRRERFIHRIIWIGTDFAVESYADHRIPYDALNCSLEVHALRTWRDGRWWESGPTAKVETLPAAVREAYDYTNIREMMLLHDGVELPCIIEVAYTITDKESFREGEDGLWVFNRREASVKSVFELGLAPGMTPRFMTANGAPSPSKTIQDGIETYIWEMGLLEALPRTGVEDPAAYYPWVAWSNWDNWKVLGQFIKERFDAAARLNGTLRHCLDSIAKDSRTMGEKAQKIAEFIDKNTRSIDYSEDYWQYDTRPALRTYETAYGHRLDRAVLAAALFRGAGFEAEPIFVSKGYGEVETGITLSDRFRGIDLWVNDAYLEAFYDPGDNSLERGIGYTYGRSQWKPGLDDKPVAGENGNTSDICLLDATVSLDILADKDTIFGSGSLSGSGVLSPYANLVGSDNEAEDFAGKFGSSLIKGTRLESYNPELLEPGLTVIAFDFNLDKPESDDSDRIRLSLGSPSGGIRDRLRDDIRLYHNRRVSPVSLPGPLKQDLTFKLNTEGYELIYHPEDRVIENEAGRFEIVVGIDGDRIMVRRTVHLKNSFYSRDQWPDLRQLLLADENERNRVILLKRKTPDEKG